jgi:hypothetical protein
METRDENVYSKRDNNSTLKQEETAVAQEYRTVALVEKNADGISQDLGIEPKQLAALKSDVFYAQNIENMLKPVELSNGNELDNITGQSLNDELITQNTLNPVVNLSGFFESTMLPNELVSNSLDTCQNTYENRMNQELIDGAKTTGISLNLSHLEPTTRPKTTALDSAAQDLGLTEIGEIKKAEFMKESNLFDKVPKINTFELKSITYNNYAVQIVTQNENGPCPLIGIGMEILILVNALLLRGDLKLKSYMPTITNEEILILLVEFIMDIQLEKFKSEAGLDETLDSVLQSLYSLETGLDVNLYFKNCDSFEFTMATTVLDVCQIKLYHGWVISTQDWRYDLIANQIGSYNAAADAVIRAAEAEIDISSQKFKASSKGINLLILDEIIAKGNVIREFLAESASQITCLGLEMLLERIPEDIPSLFFRNNHFQTIVKHQNQLYTLVTDQGYIKNEHIVWETLDTVTGDSEFCNERFHRIDQNRSDLLSDFQNDIVSNYSFDHQVDADFELSKKLQQMEYKLLFI